MAAHSVLLIIVAASLALMLTRPREIAEVYWAGGGALLLVILRLVPPRRAGHAVAAGSDVYFFLTGMMLLSELARAHGVFDWLASHAVSAARDSTLRLFTLIYCVGILTTIFLSNDATAVVLTPAVLTVMRKARVHTLAPLFACALVANAASFVLPISNPANLVLFDRQIPALGLWLKAFGVPSLLSILATYWVLRLVFRRELQGGIEAEVKPEALQPGGRLVLLGLAGVIALLLTCSALDWSLGLPTCAAALAVAAAVSIRARSNPLRILRHVSWSTLLLVAALFILVNAVESAGALTVTGAALRRALHLAPQAGALAAGFTVAVADTFANNLPIGLLTGSTLRQVHTGHLLANALLIGVDLGPELSVTGSLATILWLLALRRQNLQVSFWKFFRIGVLVMPLGLLAALGGAIVMQFIFH